MYFAANMDLIFDVFHYRKPSYKERNLTTLTLTLPLHFFIVHKSLAAASWHFSIPVRTAYVTYFSTPNALIGRDALLLVILLFK